MSDELHRAISTIEISKRINEAATSFNVTLKTPLDPTEFDTGSSFVYTITDDSLPDGYVGLTGLVETLDTDYTDNNKLWGLGGRDKGLNLVTNGFTLDSDTVNPVEYTVMELLDLILTGTGITIGRGQKALSKVITLTTNGEADNRYCGDWNTKEDAINALFAQYVRFSGAKQFKWYIDFGGQFRWFELNTNRTNWKYYFDDDLDVISFKPKKDATSIQNSFTGFYGDEEDQTSVTVTDTASIATYGLRPAQPLTQSNYTLDEMTARLNWELERKCVPIHTATVELGGIHIVEPGTQVQFPDKVKYEDVEWTVVDWKLTINKPGKNITTLGLSTDMSAISLTNEYEAIQAIASKEVEDNKAMVATVTSIPSTSSDRCNVWLGMAGSSGAVVSVRNPGGNWALGS